METIQPNIAVTIFFTLKTEVAPGEFNEPMAGLSALVEGEVAAIRPATEAEIAEACENHQKRKIGFG